MSMDIAGVVAALRENRMFARLDDKRLRVVALTGEVLSYRDGEHLFERGDDGDAAFVVLEGAALVQIDGQVIARLGRGELLGEIAVLCDRPRTTGIVAEGDFHALSLARDDLRSLLREFPDFALEMIRTMALRLERTNLAYIAAAKGAT
jgi:CRP/FNR family cyclic AMP-dependent transcriptional regulator